MKYSFNTCEECQETRQLQGPRELRPLPPPQPPVLRCAGSGSGWSLYIHLSGQDIHKKVNQLGKPSFNL